MERNGRYTHPQLDRQTVDWVLFLDCESNQSIRPPANKRSFGDPSRKWHTVPFLRGIVITAFVSSAGFAKWLLPVLYGGEPYTFGLMADEWILVFLLGIGCSIMHSPSSFWQPINYIVFAYCFHFPFFLLGKFSLLFLGFRVYVSHRHVHCGDVWPPGLVVVRAVTWKEGTEKGDAAQLMSKLRNGSSVLAIRYRWVHPSGAIIGGYKNS